ncbi:protein yippee-like At5g53940 [Amaranthus tricolor]|uniref:protein yippee-like At5g53940 n=1 Tax=Amaranthus tricolor TaxID=29722 RepID=UPI00258B2601|nr:protein yippee-like At5g53940 [Amaranthus tricolor]
MGRVFLVELDGKVYRCRCCDSPLALADDILSRSFSCRKGRAYLFENAVNVTTGPEEDRLMMSGMHTVADIFCCGCGQLLGWKYMVARDKNQKYKEGKVVLERWRISEDSSEEFNVDDRQNSSDPEYP